MSNLEHLIENGLSALKRGVGYEKWLKTMKDDVNWQDNENISIEQLWTICQYVIYTWIPPAESEIAENLYLCKCHITDKDGLQHEVIHTGDIRRVTGWEI